MITQGAWSASSHNVEMVQEGVDLRRMLLVME